MEEIAFGDYLTRRFFEASRTVAVKPRGTGNSGLITISRPSQAILERNCFIVTKEPSSVKSPAGSQV